MAEPQTLLGSWAGPAVAPELAVRSGPRSVGAPALHLMHSGRVSQPRAPVARWHSPSNAPARARNAHSLGGPRTHGNARTRRAAIHSPAPRDARSVPRPGTLPVAAGVTALGRRGRAGSSLLADPSTTRSRAFVLPLRRGAGPSLRRPACRDSRLSSGSLSLSLFPNPLLFSPPSGSPGKVASPSLPKSLSSLRGGGGDWGRVGARSIPGSSTGGAPAFPRAAWLSAAAGAHLIPGAEPWVRGRLPESTLISRRTQGACFGEGIRVAQLPFFRRPLLVLRSPWV